MEPALPRDRLIAAATRAFLAEGYGAANLSRIARAAGISKKTIYQHVASKADLFEAVVQAHLHQVGFDRLLVAPDHGDPESALRSSLLKMTKVAFSPEGIAVYRLIITEAVSFPEVALAYVRALSAYSQELIRWLDDQVRKGWLRLADPPRASRMLVGMILSEARRNSILGLAPPPSADEQARMVDEALAIFLRGSLARAG